MMKRFFAIYLLICGVFLPSRAYTNKPVMVNLNVARQSDTMGFNMAFELINFFHNQIIEENVVLWDSPRKSFKISTQALAAIEVSSKTEFAKAADVFLHEFWTSGKRHTSFTVMGISFINQGPKGRVSYGYVDFAECWNRINNFLIDCNVNGPARLTLINAIYSRNYNFNVVQFGNKTFIDKPEDAIKIRDRAFYGNRFVEGLYTIPRTKDISYIIEPDVNESKEIGNVFFSNIQNYLNKNKEVLFNLGGNRYFDYKTFRSEVAVTRIEVNEIWTKKPTYVDYNIISVTIFVNNKKLDPLPPDVLLGWGILYNFKTSEDVLKEKKFKYSLIKLNNTFVTEADSPKFLKSLEKYSWTQVSRYVKFY